MNIKTNSHFKQFIRTNVLLLLLAGFQLSAWADDVTATWDFQNNNPNGIIQSTSFERTTGTVNSNIDGIALTVDATNGKFAFLAGGLTNNIWVGWLATLVGFVVLIVVSYFLQKKKGQLLPKLTLDSFEEEKDVASTDSHAE